MVNFEKNPLGITKKWWCRSVRRFPAFPTHFRPRSFFNLILPYGRHFVSYRGQNSNGLLKRVSGTLSINSLRGKHLVQPY